MVHIEHRNVRYIRPPPRYIRIRIYYSIRFLEPATGEIRTIAELGKLACRDLAISPDRRWALYTQTDQSSSDLMLVEDFR